jgi:hypothetical protein
MKNYFTAVTGQVELLLDAPAELVVDRPVFI